MVKIGTLALAENWINFFETSQRTHFFVNILLNKCTNRKKYPRPRKSLYVEKIELKLTKNRIFGYGILTSFRKPCFSTMNIENNYNKVHIAKNYIKNCV